MNSVTLRQDDFTTANNGGMNMWSALVEAAVSAGVVPEGTKSEDVLELNVVVIKG